MIGVVVIFLFAIFSFTGLWDDDVLPTVLARSSIILLEENWAGKACTREKSTTYLDSGHIFCEWERCACARPVEPQRVRKSSTYRRNPSKQKVQLLIFTQSINTAMFSPIKSFSSNNSIELCRLSGKFSCPMDLRYFPMDSQLCYMEIESCKSAWNLIPIIISIIRFNIILLIKKFYSYPIHLVGYTMADIKYKWNDGLNSVQLSSDVSLPAFKVLGHRQKTIEASLSTGNSIDQ